MAEENDALLKVAVCAPRVFMAAHCIVFPTVVARDVPSRNALRALEEEQTFVFVMEEEKGAKPKDVKKARREAPITARLMEEENAACGDNLDRVFVETVIFLVISSLGVKLVSVLLMVLRFKTSEFTVMVVWA